MNDEIDGEQAEEKRVGSALTRAKWLRVVALSDDEGGRQSADAFAAQAVPTDQWRETHPAVMWALSVRQPAATGQTLDE